MTFHAYLQYVCLLVVCLCTLPSPMEARVQADRQSTGTRDTLLVIDQESGLPIEGAYILTRERLLVSSPRGMIVFGHGTCFMDTVLVQCLGYGSRRVPLNEVFKESSICKLAKLAASPHPHTCAYIIMQQNNMFQNSTLFLYCDL